MLKRDWLWTCLILASACHITYAQEAAPSYPNPSRFEKDILAFEEQDKESSPPENAILCYGSSSIRFWHKHLAEDLSPLTVIPRGFGGSNMNDALFFADRVVIPAKPRAILLYEGDNDIGQKIPPEKILETFQSFVDKIHSKLPDTRIYVIAVKPSILRWRMWPTIQETNQLLSEVCAKNPQLTFIDIASPMLTNEGLPRKELFCNDRLHMNRQGYEIWRDTIRPVLITSEGKFETQK